MNTDDGSTFEKPWLFRDKPALVAHRGYAQNYPENTLCALRAAVEEGAKFVEFDVQFSKDKIPFLIHDDNFQRTAGLALSVFDLTMAQIGELSVGEPNRFGDRYADEKSITLEALCDQLNNWPDVYSFIEIKRQSIEHFGLETVVNGVLDAIDSLVAPHAIISFRDDAVALTKQLSSKHTGWVIPQWSEASLQTLGNLAPDFAFCNYEKVPKNISLPKDNVTWVLYEIGTPEEATYCRQVGADLIETMAVAPMLKTLGETSE